MASFATYGDRRKTTPSEAILPKHSGPYALRLKAAWRSGRPVERLTSWLCRDHGLDFWGYTRAAYRYVCHRSICYYSNNLRGRRVVQSNLRGRCCSRPLGDSGSEQRRPCSLRGELPRVL